MIQLYAKFIVDERIVKQIKNEGCRIHRWNWKISRFHRQKFSTDRVNRLWRVYPKVYFVNNSHEYFHYLQAPRRRIDVCDLKLLLYDRKYTQCFIITLSHDRDLIHKTWKYRVIYFLFLSLSLFSHYISCLSMADHTVQKRFLAI